MLASLLIIAPLSKELGLLPETNVQSYNPISAQLSNNKLYVQSLAGAEHVLDCSTPRTGGLECVLEQEVNSPQIPRFARTQESNRNQVSLYAPAITYSVPLQR